jgi:hypothetical protein
MPLTASKPIRRAALDKVKTPGAVVRDHVAASFRPLNE